MLIDGADQEQEVTDGSMVGVSSKRTNSHAIHLQKNKSVGGCL